TWTSWLAILLTTCTVGVTQKLRGQDKAPASEPARPAATRASITITDANSETVPAQKGLSGIIKPQNLSLSTDLRSPLPPQANDASELPPPRVVRFQEVPMVTDPTFPLPLYHDRPEKGGFYAAAEFLYWKMKNPLDNQIIAVRGLLDFDGSITA